MAEIEKTEWMKKAIHFSSENSHLLEKELNVPKNSGRITLDLNYFK
jgi:hypothetical protein